MTSKKPRKQRKRHFEAKKHERHKKMAAPVKEGKTKPVRKGDKVKVLRGDHKGEEGEVIGVDRKKYRIKIKGITRRKQDGEEIPVPIHPSNVIITKEHEEEGEEL